MASRNLRVKQPKNYRTVLGLKPAGIKKPKTKRVSAAVLPAHEVEEDLVDVQGEREVLEGDSRDTLPDEDSDELVDEDLDTEQILALAEQEEACCLALEEEVE